MHERRDVERGVAVRRGRHGIVLGGALAVASCAGPHPHHPHGHHGHHGEQGLEHWRHLDDPARDGCQVWAMKPRQHSSWRHLDDPARDGWQKPSALVAAAGLAEGHVVADLGAGTGYLEPHLSRAVGARGKVLALDVSAELVEHMKRRFHEAGLGNVEARRVAPEDPGLAAGSVDRVLVVDVWHHLGDRVAYARRLREALAPGGRVLVVDYEADAPQGPPPELRLAAETIVQELTAAGFTARVVPETLPRQYVVVAEPAP